MTRGNSNHLPDRISPAFLRERELAARWSMSQRTLQRWRAEGYGPAWVCIGGAIRYRFEEVMAFEKRHCHGGSER